MFCNDNTATDNGKYIYNINLKIPGIVYSKKQRDIISMTAY